MMKTISLRVEETTKERWDKLSKQYGLNQSGLMREAIIDKLEELEDFYAVKKRLATPYEPILNEQVWKKLGHTD